MERLLVKNGLVVTEGSEAICDVLCEGGKIERVGRNIVPEGAADTEIIDAAGKIVIPGGVDVHTHLDLDAGIATASDDFFTGTRAAAFGGTTTIVDHPAFGPAGCALDYQIEKYHGKAAGNAVIDYGFHGVIQYVDENVFAMMDALAERGITSFKIYLTYGFKISDADAFRVLRRAKELNALVMVHSENDGVINLLRREFIAAGKTAPRFHPLSRPVECEAEAIGRMILLSRMANDAPLYIVHLSGGLGLDFITAARKRGQKNLFAETCPQYLVLDESRYSLPDGEGLKYIMCPPLRTTLDNEALWRGLEHDINTLATDHCPFFFETQKKMGVDDFTKCPSGVPGIEERIPFMYSEGVVKKRISLRRFVELCCTAPAKLAGMYPQKGIIAAGSDADIVVIDPDKKMTFDKAMIHSNVDYSVYEGVEVSGWPVYTISRGEVIVRGGEFLGERGRGRFVKRGKFTEL